MITNLLKLSITNLLRFKTRNFLCLVAIASSIAVFFSILSLNKSFDAEVKRDMDRIGLDFVVAPGSCPHELASLLFHGSVPPSFMDESIVREVRKTKGLAYASPLLIIDVPSPEKGDKILVYGYEMPFIEQLKPEWRVDGEIPIGWDAIAANKVLLGWDFAQKHGLKIGDAIPLPEAGRTLSVSGIIKRTYTKDDAFIHAPLLVTQQIALKVSGKMVVVSEDPVCSVLGKITPDPISAVAVKLDDPAQIVPVSAELEQKVPGIQIVTISQATNSISNLIASVNALGLSVSIIIFIVASAGIMNSILMTIFEWTSQLGMMRAIGASRADIFNMVVLESIILTALGGIGGIALALCSSSGIEWLIARILVYAPGGHMIVFDRLITLWCLLLSVSMGVCAGLFPAWMASRVNPIEAIRGN
ncbi:MAG: FtsX-like permease family protein [Syntrophobacter sp.]